MEEDASGNLVPSSPASPMVRHSDPANESVADPFGESSSSSPRVARPALRKFKAPPMPPAPTLPPSPPALGTGESTSEPLVAAGNATASIEEAEVVRAPCVATSVAPQFDSVVAPTASTASTRGGDPVGSATTTGITRSTDNFTTTSTSYPGGLAASTSLEAPLTGAYRADSPGALAAGAATLGGDLARFTAELHNRQRSWRVQWITTALDPSHLAVPTYTVTSSIVTFSSSKSGPALGSGDRAEDEEVDDAPTTFTVTRSLMDLMRFRLAYLQLKPYLLLGDLPKNDGFSSRGADDVLTFLHILVHNPTLNHAPLTWALLTSPREDLVKLNLPSTGSVAKAAFLGVGGVFGPKSLPTSEALKAPHLSPFIAESVGFVEEVFRVLDLVDAGSEIARQFVVSQKRFHDRAGDWEQLVQAISAMTHHQVEMGRAAAAVHDQLRRMAQGPVLFWPWTREHVMESELALRRQEQLDAARGPSLSETARMRAQHHASPMLAPTSGGSPFGEKDDDDEQQQHAATYSGSPLRPAAAAARAPHGSIRLAHACLTAANQAEDVARHDSNVLDFFDLRTAAALMARVDRACSTSCELADVQFRASVEVRVLLDVLKETHTMAAQARLEDMIPLTQTLTRLGAAARQIIEHVKAVQDDLRAQMQAVREATVGILLSELHRTATAKAFEWKGAAVLAAELQRRVHAMLASTPEEARAAKSGPVARTSTLGARTSQSEELLPFFRVGASPPAPGDVASSGAGSGTGAPSGAAGGSGSGGGGAFSALAKRVAAKVHFGPPVLERPPSSAAAFTCSGDTEADVFRVDGFSWTRYVPAAVASALPTSSTPAPAPNAPKPQTAAEERAAERKIVAHPTSSMRRERSAAAHKVAGGYLDDPFAPIEARRPLAPPNIAQGIQ